MYQVLRELLPKNGFEPDAPTRSAAPPTGAITSGPAQPVVASPVTHRLVPDLSHPSNTIKGSLGKRPIDIGDFITEFEPTGERIDHHLGNQGCAEHCNGEDHDLVAEPQRG